MATNLDKKIGNEREEIVKIPIKDKEHRTLFARNKTDLDGRTRSEFNGSLSLIDSSQIVDIERQVHNDRDEIFHNLQNSKLPDPDPDYFKIDQDRDEKKVGDTDEN